jgi:hypothetical protein
MAGAAAKAPSFVTKNPGVELYSTCVDNSDWDRFDVGGASTPRSESNVFCCRFVRCTCRGGKPRAAWPLRGMDVKRTLPELSYLLAKWGSTMSYRRAAQLLNEFLAIVERQNLSGDSAAPRLCGRRAARPEGDGARRIRLARFAPSPSTAR